MNIVRLASVVTISAVIVGGVAACEDDEVSTKPAPVTSQSAEGTASGAPPPATSSGAAKVGDTISLKGATDKYDVAVLKLVDPASSTFGKPSTGNRYVAVQWKLTNTDNDAIRATPRLGSSVIDAQGQEMDADLSETSAGPAFPVGVSIAPGESRTGYVMYEVPADSKVAKIQFTADAGFGNKTAQWNIS